jgi:hypothetical protein
LGRVVLTKQIDESVLLSKGEGVGKVEGWEENGSVLVMATTLSLKVEAEAAVVVMVVVAVVERLEGVAVGADGKVVMVELEALKEGGSSGKVVVGILNARVEEEDAEVVLLGAGAAGHPREAAAGDSQKVVEEVVGWMMEAVVVVVWRAVEEEAGVLRVGEVGARDSSSKTLEFWDREESAVRLSKSSMTSRKRTFR